MLEGCLSTLAELAFHLLLLGTGWVVMQVITLGKGRVGQPDPTADQPDDVRYFSEGSVQGMGCVGLIAIGALIYFLSQLANP
ncbi:MAG: hypothetical protein K8L97_08215 [Anaerolineae bacterium]|nr:hypothetical protein [Anaerolineae bacterium]